MSLLSLPIEVLHRIVHFATIIPEEDDGCNCTDPNHLHISLPIPHFYAPLVATSLAHTSQTLRALSFPLMYASIAAVAEYTPSMHTQLTSSPPIASLVQRLTIFVGDDVIRTPISANVNSPINLHHLRLNGDHVHRPRDLAGIHPGLLQHLSRTSQRSFDLRGAMYGGLVPYLKHLSAPANGFVALHTVRIHELPGTCRIAALRPSPARPALTAHPATQLSSVRKLIFRTSPFAFLPWRAQCFAGAFIAETMPRVAVLDLAVGGFCAQSMVHMFTTLGTDLTDLTLHFEDEETHMCCAVAGLAPKLRRFVAHGGTACHEMFEDTQWAQIVDFEMICAVRCDAVQPELLREALIRLVGERPGVKLSVVTRAGLELASWNLQGKEDRVVPLVVFEESQALEVPPGWVFE